MCFQLLNGETSLLASLMCDDEAPWRFQQRLVGDSLNQSSWLTKDLEELFFYLAQKMPCKLFVLLDGLDEVNDSDHPDLVSTIMRLSAIDNVKICCASRPQEPFRSSFASPFSLQVQNLTKSDIAKVVNDKLQNTRASRLANVITKRSEGVFLWARLVTDDVYGACVRGESDKELKARVADVSIRSLPLFHFRRMSLRLKLLSVGFGALDCEDEQVHQPLEGLRCCRWLPDAIFHTASVVIKVFRSRVVGLTSSRHPVT